MRKTVGFYFVEGISGVFRSELVIGNELFDVVQLLGQVLVALLFLPAAALLEIRVIVDQPLLSQFVLRRSLSRF